MPIKLISLIMLFFSFSTMSFPTKTSKLTKRQSSSLSHLKIRNKDNFKREFEKGESFLSVIVILKKETDNKLDELPKTTKENRKKFKENNHKRLTRFLNSKSKSIKLRKEFSYIRGFALTIPESELDNLLNDPEVQSVEIDSELSLHTEEGLPLISATQDDVDTTGSGVAVAIIDTGIDTRHQVLGGDGTNSSSTYNNKVIGGYDFTDNDSDQRPTTSSYHGTAVAGIVAGNGLLGNFDYNTIPSVGISGDIQDPRDYRGAAPDAKLYSLRTYFTGSQLAQFKSAVISSIEWSVTHQYDDPQNPILAINISQGYGKYSSACDSSEPSMNSAVELARSNGITIVASAGNDGWCESLTAPSCLSGVISVGATYDISSGTSNTYKVSATSCNPIDTSKPSSSSYFWTTIPSLTAGAVIPYSNTASFLDVLAPAAFTRTPDPIGDDGRNTSASSNLHSDWNSQFAGTSAAAPYVSGLVARLQERAFTLTGEYLKPDQIKQALIQGGTPKTDNKINITKPLVNLEGADNLVPSLLYKKVKAYRNGQLYYNGQTPIANTMARTTTCPNIQLNYFNKSSGATNFQCYYGSELIYDFTKYSNGNTSDKCKVYINGQLTYNGHMNISNTFCRETTCFNVQKNYFNNKSDKTVLECLHGSTLMYRGYQYH